MPRREQERGLTPEQLSHVCALVQARVMRDAGGAEPPRGWQKKLETELGISQPVWSGIWNHRPDKPARGLGIAVLIALANWLGLTIDELVGLKVRTAEEQIIKIARAVAKEMAAQPHDSPVPPSVTTEFAVRNPRR